MGKVPTFSGSLLLLIALPFLMNGAALLSLEKRFQTEGRVQNGSITRKFQTEQVSFDPHANPPLSSQSSVVEYVFAEDGRFAANGSDEIREELWERLNIGDVVQIQYLNSSPEHNRILPQDHSLKGFLFLVVGVLGSLLGIRLMRLGSRHRRSQKLLHRRGEITEGMISHIEQSPRKTHSSIRYTFRDPDGHVWSGSCNRFTSRSGEQLEVGKRIPIKFLPRDPSYNMVMNTDEGPVANQAAR